jgi:hypothetical protein
VQFRDEKRAVARDVHGNAARVVSFECADRDRRVVDDRDSDLEHNSPTQDARCL